jgi:hypothetical protein
MEKTMTDKKTEPEPTADEKARKQREIGDASIVYGEMEQNDEQRDVNQPEPDEHV